VSEKWIDGPPPVEGAYWIAWNPDGRYATVVAVHISPAVIHMNTPGATLLIKQLGGVAYEYEPIKHNITHHMPMVVPAPPKQGDLL